MGFFDTLRRVLGQEDAGAPRDAAGGAAAPGPTADEPGSGSGFGSGDGDADPGLYDRTNWHKKLKRVLGELPASEGRWPELVSEARALNLDPEWVAKCQVDEFLMLVRRAVSDGHFTEPDHRKLDLARDLIGLPEAEAEAALHAIVAEAERFFGKAVEGA